MHVQFAELLAIKGVGFGRPYQNLARFEIDASIISIGSTADLFVTKNAAEDEDRKIANVTFWA